MPLKIAGREIKTILVSMLAINTPRVVLVSAIHL